MLKSQHYFNKHRPGCLPHPGCNHPSFLPGLLDCFGNLHVCYHLGSAAVPEWPGRSGVVPNCSFDHDTLCSDGIPVACSDWFVADIDCHAMLVIDPLVFAGNGGLPVPSYSCLSAKMVFLVLVAVLKVFRLYQEPET